MYKKLDSPLFPSIAYVHVFSLVTFEKSRKENVMFVVLHNSLLGCVNQGTVCIFTCNSVMSNTVD